MPPNPNDMQDALDHLDRTAAELRAAHADDATEREQQKALRAHTASLRRAIKALGGSRALPMRMGVKALLGGRNALSRK